MICSRFAKAVARLLSNAMIAALESAGIITIYFSKIRVAQNALDPSFGGELPPHPAAIHRQDRAGHVIRCRAGQEDDRAGKILGAAQRPAGMRARIAAERSGSLRSASVLSVAI